jgi:AcrR family transcriptional regulator
MGIAERKEREKKERRQQILEAAKRHFSSKGFSGTTMGDIATDIELSPSTLYLYFTNKEELHAALSLQLLESLLERLEQIEERDEQSPEKRIVEIKDMLYSLYAFDPLIFMNVFHFQTSEVYRNISQELMAEIKGFAGRALNSMARIFEEGIRKGLFKDRKPIALADVIWSVFSGMVIWEESKKALEPQKSYMKETLDLAFEIIIQGIKKI